MPQIKLTESGPGAYVCGYVTLAYTCRDGKNRVAVLYEAEKTEAVNVEWEDAERETNASADREAAKLRQAFIDSRVGKVDT